MERADVAERMVLDDAENVDQDAGSLEYVLHRRRSLDKLRSNMFERCANRIMPE